MLGKIDRIDLKMLRLLQGNGRLTNAELAQLVDVSPATCHRRTQALFKEGYISRVRAMIVPGSGLVKHQAEEEGLDRVFLEAGFEWREPGCSNCMSMNNDRAENGERIASTSNRNFEGRQGKNAKTHLMGPAMAAAAAVTGHLADVRQLG